MTRRKEPEVDVALDTVLETPRCVLRAPSRTDMPHIFLASRVPGFTDGMLWSPPETLEELEGPLETNLAAWRAGTAYTFTVETRAFVFVGRVALRRIAQGRVWNLGFWTHPEQQGRGYATEAATAVLRFGFTRLGAERVEACHALWNRGSRRVLETLGMTFARHVLEGFQKNGVWVAEDCLGVSRDEWTYLCRFTQR